MSEEIINLDDIEEEQVEEKIEKEEEHEQETQNEEEPEKPVKKSKKKTTKKAQKSEKSTKKKKGKTDYKMGFIKRIVASVVICFIVFTFVFGITIVKGNYMFPAFRDGDLIITYKLEKAVSSEVVAYKSTEGTKLGRIVAIDGDTVEITSAGELLVNGSRASEEIFYPTSPMGSNITYPYKVPHDSVFVLNDYRTIGENDSRTLGAIPKSSLKGKVSFVFRRRGF